MRAILSKRTRMMLASKVERPSLVASVPRPPLVTGDMSSLLRSQSASAALWRVRPSLRRLPLFLTLHGHPFHLFYLDSLSLKPECPCIVSAASSKRKGNSGCSLYRALTFRHYLFWDKQSCGIWRRLVWWIDSNVLEEPSASIIRVPTRLHGVTSK